MLWILDSLLCNLYLMVYILGVVYFVFLDECILDLMLRFADLELSVFYLYWLVYGEFCNCVKNSVWRILYWVKAILFFGVQQFEYNSILSI